MNLNQVTLPAIDINEADQFYSGLGLNIIVRTSHYLRFELPEGDSTLSIHLVRHLSKETGVSIYFEMEDVDGFVKKIEKRGYTLTSQATDESWLWREARIKDPAGNTLVFYHAGVNRKNPPWRI